MLINEAGFVKAIKDAYRGGGYTFYNQGQEIVMYCNHWFVKCDRDSFPKKALAVVVEHIGDIPGEGEPTEIVKKMEPQIIMDEVADEDVGRWAMGGRDGEVTATPIIMQGLQVFQEEDGGNCYGVDLLHLGIVDRMVAERKSAVAMDGCKLLFALDGELTVIEAVRKADANWPTDWERAVWKALESMDLHRGED